MTYTLTIRLPMLDHIYITKGNGKEHDALWKVGGALELNSYTHSKKNKQKRQGGR